MKNKRTTFPTCGDAQDYLTERGWVFARRVPRLDLYVFTHPDLPGQQREVQKWGRAWEVQA